MQTRQDYFRRFMPVLDWGCWLVGFEWELHRWFSLHVGPLEFVWFIRQKETDMT